EYCAASAGPHSAASTPAYSNLFTLFIIFLPAAALKLRFCRYCRPFFLLGLPLFQKTYPGWHVLTVVAPDAPADEIAVHHARRVDVDAAADLQVEAALGDRRHATPAHAVGARWHLDAVADACDRLFGGEEGAGDLDEVGIVADVLGGAPAGEE